MSEALTVKLPDFEGPLDLLVHLIEKDKVDIYDIPIVSIRSSISHTSMRCRSMTLIWQVSFYSLQRCCFKLNPRMLLPKDDAEEDEENDRGTCS